MFTIKLLVEDVKEITKKSDGTPLYVVSLLTNRGRDKSGDYLKDVSLFTDEKTYNLIKEGKDVIVKFTGEHSVKA